MDHFGIGNALRGVAIAYFQGARRTGKTTFLLDSIKDGDRVACATRGAAEDLSLRCRERGLNVECIVLKTNSPRELFERQLPTKGHTIFDHGLVERYYMDALKSAQREIDYFQQQFSADPATEPSRYFDKA